jgi:hypothetical protein
MIEANANIVGEVSENERVLSVVRSSSFFLFVLVSACRYPPFIAQGGRPVYMKGCTASSVIYRAAHP